MKAKYICDKCGDDFSSEKECMMHERTCGTPVDLYVTAVTMSLSLPDMRLHARKERYYYGHVGRDGGNAYINGVNYDGDPLVLLDGDGKARSILIRCIDRDKGVPEAVRRIVEKMIETCRQEMDPAMMEKGMKILSMGDDGLEKLVAAADGDVDTGEV